jgi:hypothetical protein
MGRPSQLVSALIVLLSLPVQQAVADIFQYTDDKGVIHFSNVSVGGSKKYRKVKSEPTGVQSREQTRFSPARVTASSASTKKIPSAYVDIINSACDRHGIDPALVHAVK